MSSLPLHSSLVDCRVLDVIGSKNVYNRIKNMDKSRDSRMLKNEMVCSELTYSTNVVKRGDYFLILEMR